VHQYVDSSVTNGKTYYYAVVSYDRGFDSLTIQLPPTESQSVISKDPITSELSFDVNTVAVTPGPPPAGTLAAHLSDAKVERVQGVSTGTINPQILDPSLIDDGTRYEISFANGTLGINFTVQPLKFYTETFSGDDTIYVPLLRRNILRDSVEVRDARGNVVAASGYDLDTVRGRIRGRTAGALAHNQSYTIRYKYLPIVKSQAVNNEDVTPVFDGVRLFLKDESLGLDSARSGWAVVNNTNLKARIQKPVALVQTFTPQPFDVEVRWNRTDTLANGKWAFPGDTMLTNNGQRIAVAPFRIVNVTTGATFRLFCNGAVGDSLWKPGREIILLTPSGAITTYIGITFDKSNGDPIVYPTQGNVYVAKTSKPFTPGDKYQFQIFAPRYDAATAKSALDNIYVVPNPYVAYSTLEQPSTVATRRGDARLQFRNLPPQCTIRIYTVLGELVDTIVKDDAVSYADWAILSSEGHRLAYGVYIYHVDVPGVGQKIGRFALIK
jgi:hypothetical protein